MESTSKNRKLKLSKLVLLAAAGIFVGTIAALWSMAPELLSVYYRLRWKADLDHAMQIWCEDRTKAEQMITETINQRIAEHVPIAEQMTMRREYAEKLYAASDWRKGNEQIELAISACANGKPNNGAEAFQLGDAYQDRAGNEHARYLTNSKLPPGDKDQELAVAVCEKAFGRDSAEAAFKLATLGLIYTDMHLTQKGEETLQRAVTIVDSSAPAAGAKWFVYAICARAKATIRDYKGSLKAFSKARSVAKDASDQKRILEEFSLGLLRGNPAADPVVKITTNLFSEEKFDELDDLSKRLCASKHAGSDGRWRLDHFFDPLECACGQELDEEDMKVLAAKWFKRSPKSAAARIVASNKYYFTLIKDRGKTSTVTEQDRIFLDQLAKAKSVLDADPSLKKALPRVFAEYSFIARLQKDKDRTSYEKLISDCRKLWPTYKPIDFEKARYLMPRWCGKEHECENFLAQRANEIAGANGDELYAQIVWRISQESTSIFKELPQLDWHRVKAGFRRIFSDYPDDMASRAAFIKLASDANETDSIETEFSDFAQR
jgi:tetratricopeptide (TPR) repeat protein